MKSVRYGEGRVIKSHFIVTDIESLFDIMKYLKSTKDLELPLDYYRLIFEPADRLNDEDLNRIVIALTSENLPYLVNLRLFHQELKGERLGKISTLFNINAKGPQKISLDLIKNDINDHDLDEFSKGLTGLSRFISVRINLAVNNISEVGIKNFTKVFQPGNYPLERLDIEVGGNINIGFAGVQSLATMLFSNASPQSIGLNLAHCQLGNVCCNELVQAVIKGGNKRDVLIELGKNQIDNNGVAFLCPLISSDRCPPKLSIRLEQNNIGCDGLRTLLSALKQSTNLKNLSLALDLCGIKNDGLIALAETLAEKVCPSNFTVWLYDNEFDEDGLTAISNALIHGEVDFADLCLYFGGRHSISDSCKNVLLDMMMKNTKVTNIRNTVFHNEEAQDKEWKDRIDLCCFRNQLIRRFPEFKEFILERCAKAGFYIPGESKRSPASLKTLASFSFLSNLDPLDVNENKLYDPKVPSEVFSFVVEIDRLAKEIQEKAGLIRGPN